MSWGGVHFSVDEECVELDTESGIGHGCLIYQDQSLHCKHHGVCVVNVKVQMKPTFMLSKSPFFLSLCSVDLGAPGPRMFGQSTVRDP